MGSEHPEWLPKDWKVSVKRRSSGRKDKYYIHPSTGLTFNSKPEVLRHLKSSRKMSKRKETNKIDIKTTVSEKLPPGWIKEIRTKTNGDKTRRDPYYIDPVSGRQYRSMQEVFRHLKSKDSREVESKPDDKCCTSMELVDHSQFSSAEAKGQRPIGKKGDKNMTGGERIKSGPDAAALKSVEKPLAEESYREDGSGAEKLQNKLPLPNGKEQNGGRRLSKRLADNKSKHDTEDTALLSDSKFAAENNTNIQEANCEEQREKKRNCKEGRKQNGDITHQNKRKNMKRKWMSSLPRRTSKRLANLEADQPVDVKSSEKEGALPKISSEAEVGSPKHGVTSALPNEPEMDTSVKFVRTQSDEQCITENQTNDEQKETITHGNLSPEEHKSAGAVCHEHRKDEEHLDSSLKDLLMDPCIEFAIKTLTGAIPIEDVNKVDENPVSSSLALSDQMPACSSLSPCGDIWSDPCFEFAVKTLTGEMPREDGVRVQISYENPASSLPKIRVDGVCPSNYSFGQSDGKQRGV